MENSSETFKENLYKLLEQDTRLWVKKKWCIEAKGDLLIDSDTESWKKEFLEEISRKYSDGKFLTAENKHYRLIGMPFFNSAKPAPFKNEFDRKILDRKNLNVI